MPLKTMCLRTIYASDGPLQPAESWVRLLVWSSSKPHLICHIIKVQECLDRYRELGGLFWARPPDDWSAPPPCTRWYANLLLPFPNVIVQHSPTHTHKKHSPWLQAGEMTIRFVNALSLSVSGPRLPLSTASAYSTTFLDLSTSSF